MKNLLMLVLLFSASNIGAQEALPTATVVAQGYSWGSIGMPVAASTSVVSSTPGAAGQASPAVMNTPVVMSTASAIPTPGAPSFGTLISGTPVTGTVSASPTPSGTPGFMSKPPSLTMATPAATSSIGEHFVFQVDGGLVPPASTSIASEFSTGYGFDGRISYAFDDVFAIGLETGYYNLSATSLFLKNAGFPSSAASNLTHIPLLFTMQLYVGEQGGPVQPYILLAGGLGIDAYGLTGAAFAPNVVSSWTNFEFDPAIGVAFTLDKNTNLFVQAKWVMDFDNNSGTAAESADTPLMLLPLELGVNFNL